MTKTKIALCTEDYELFSVESMAEALEIIEKGLCCKSIFLMPGNSADFMLAAFCANKEEAAEYYTSALCAAAFLITKRGLPLSELVFETPEGEIEIFHTDTDKFSVKIPKCKQMLSFSTELFGSDIKGRDLVVKKRFRALHADDISVFSDDVLKRLVILDEPLPCGVLVSSSSNGNLAVRYYCGFSFEAVSPLLLYSAAAFNERIISGKAVLDTTVENEGISFAAEAFSVTVTAHAKFI